MINNIQKIFHLIMSCRDNTVFYFRVQEDLWSIIGIAYDWITYRLKSRTTRRIYFKDAHYPSSNPSFLLPSCWGRSTCRMVDDFSHSHSDEWFVYF